MRWHELTTKQLHLPSTTNITESKLGMSSPLFVSLILQPYNLPSLFLNFLRENET